MRPIDADQIKIYPGDKNPEYGYINMSEFNSIPTLDSEKELIDKVAWRDRQMLLDDEERRHLMERVKFLEQVILKLAFKLVE